MATHQTPGGTFIVESQPQGNTDFPVSATEEPQQPSQTYRERTVRTEQPQQLRQTYRGPQGVTLTDEHDQDEDNWSDSQSESDEPPNETLRQTPDMSRSVNLDGLRNRQKQRQSSPAQLTDRGDVGDGTTYTGRSNFNRPNSSYAGGQTVPYGQNNGYIPQPNPFSTEPFAPHYAANPHPPNSYHANPYPTHPYPQNLYPQNSHPTINYPTSHAYPTGPYHAHPYPTGPHHTNPCDPYAMTTHYHTTLYSTDPMFRSSQERRPSFQPDPVVKRPVYSGDSEVDKLKRELKNLKMEVSARRHQEKDRRRMEEEWEKKEQQAALEKEAKRNFEKLKRQKDREAKAQQQKSLRVKRDVAGDEEISEVIKRTVEKETKEALEKMTSGRQTEGKLHFQEVSREREKERLLIELIDFVDERRRVDGRSWDGGPVRDNISGMRRSRMELVPADFTIPARTPELTRSQIEEVVLEVLQRRSLDTEPQTPISNRQMFSSAWSDERPPLRRIPPRSYVSEPYDVGEGLRRSGEWERRDYSVRGMNPTADSRSPELPSPRTTVSDRYTPPDSNEYVNSPQASPTFRHESTRKASPRKSDPSQSRHLRDGNRPYPSAQGLHDIREQSTRDADNDGFSFLSDVQREQPRSKPSRPRLDATRHAAPTLGRGRARRTLGAQATSNNRWEATAHLAGEVEYSSSESDVDEQPPTRSSKYTFTPRKGSSSNRVVLNETISSRTIPSQTPLPAAPDPPPV